MTTKSELISQDIVDKHLDAILKASGSALRHFTMEKTLRDMRAAVLQAMVDGAELLAVVDTTAGENP